MKSIFSIEVPVESNGGNRSSLDFEGTYNPHRSSPNRIRVRLRELYKWHEEVYLIVLDVL